MNEMPDNLSEEEKEAWEKSLTAGSLPTWWKPNPADPAATGTAAPPPATPGPPPAAATTPPPPAPSSPAARCSAGAPGEERTCRLGALAHRRLPCRPGGSRATHVPLPRPSPRLPRPRSRLPRLRPRPPLHRPRSQPLRQRPRRLLRLPQLRRFRWLRRLPPSGGAWTPPPAAPAPTPPRDAETLHLERSPLEAAPAPAPPAAGPAADPYQRTMVMGTFPAAPKMASVMVRSGPDTGAKFALETSPLYVGRAPTMASSSTIPPPRAATPASSSGARTSWSSTSAAPTAPWWTESGWSSRCSPPAR